MRVLLLGLMGSGKTTVGRTLADRLGWTYVDNDEIVAEITGTSRANLLRQRGVAVLRVTEAQALRVALGRPGPFVAGIPAGVVLDPAHAAPLLELPDDVVVVWLRARIETLVDRLRREPADRPWLTGDLQESVRELAAIREPMFDRVAEVVVDVDDRTPGEVADEIITRLGLSQHGRAGGR